MTAPVNVAELVTELRHAQEIIRLASNYMPAGARSRWHLSIDDAGLCGAGLHGNGVTRSNERRDLLARVGGAA